MRGQVSFYNHHTNAGQDGKTDVCRKKRNITHKVEQEQYSLPNPWIQIQVAEKKKKKEIKPSSLGTIIYNGLAVDKGWITEHPNHQHTILAKPRLGCLGFSFPNLLQKLSVTVVTSFHFLELRLEYVASSMVISKYIACILWEKKKIKTKPEFHLSRSDEKYY